MDPAQERRDKIARIAALPANLEAAIAGLKDNQLDTPYREGGWTIREVVHHLADSHMNAYVRMKLIVTEDNPTLKPYDQDLWAKTADVREVPLGQSLAILMGLHERWVVFMRSLPDDAWKRTAIHPERGTVTLEAQLNVYAGHGERHVGQISGLRTEKGW